MGNRLKTKAETQTQRKKKDFFSFRGARAGEAAVPSSSSANDAGLSLSFFWQLGTIRQSKAGVYTHTHTLTRFSILDSRLAYFSSSGKVRSYLCLALSGLSLTKQNEEGENDGDDNRQGGGDRHKSTSQ